MLIESVKKESQELKIIRPENAGASELSTLISYLTENKKFIEDQLMRCGAVLFRGFNITTRDEFLEVKKCVSGDSHFNYVDGNSPRSKLSKEIYTSTEFPKENKITLHNELSYTNSWPEKLYFFCETAAETGGETPIADCRYILTLLDPEIVMKFEKLGVKYTRCLNNGTGLGKSWMDTFETKDIEFVKDYCLKNNIALDWQNNSVLLSQVGVGVSKHPVTQEKVWFNQADQFHPSSLPGDVYDALKLIYKDSKTSFPHYSYYGNGEEIQEEHLNTITSTFLNNAILVKWEKGDVLLLDNMLMAHGRMPFTGPRKIYVSMT